MKKIILVIATFALLVGCSKLTIENYETLELGMDYRDIEILLGNPTKCDELLGIKQCQWGDDSKYIDVKFVADKATIFSKKGL